MVLGSLDLAYCTRKRRKRTLVLGAYSWDVRNTRRSPIAPGRGKRVTWCLEIYKYVASVTRLFLLHQKEEEERGTWFPKTPAPEVLMHRYSLYYKLSPLPLRDLGLPKPITWLQDCWTILQLLLTHTGWQSNIYFGLCIECLTCSYSIWRFISFLCDLYSFRGPL